MDLSITIASYNSCQITLQALESIQKETQGCSYEIIVVDNASTDGSADIIASKFPQVNLIRSKRNLGFAAAHNLALAAAKGDFLLVLNSDVLFVGNSAGQMISRFRSSRKEIGVMGPQILNPDGSRARSTRRQVIYSQLMVALTTFNQSFPFIKLFPVEFMQRYFSRIMGRVHDNFAQPTTAEEVAWIDGMCVMFRREVLEQVGLFDEQYFFDCEIGDLLIRATDKGFFILFDPDIKIIHLGGYSRKRASRIMIESQRSQLIYYSRHRPTYIPMLRYVNMIRFWLEIKVIQLKRTCLFNSELHDQELKILEEVFKLVEDFDPATICHDERTPKLLKGDNKK